MTGNEIVAELFLTSIDNSLNKKYNHFRKYTFLYIIGNTYEIRRIQKDSEKPACYQKRVSKTICAPEAVSQHPVEKMDQEGVYYPFA